MLGLLGFDTWGSILRQYLMSTQEQGTGAIKVKSMEGQLDPAQILA